MLMITIIQKTLDIQIIGVIIPSIIVVKLQIGLISPTITEVFVLMRLSEGVLVPEFLM